MNVFKRCKCADPSRCRHPLWYAFKFRGQLYRRTTRTANRQLAERIGTKHRAAILEGREGLRSTKPVKLSAHVKAYTEHTAKSNRSSYKDVDVLNRLVESVGDRLITDVSPFHIERWKSQRAENVSRSTVNRELNIVRGCFSRAVEWGRLGISPLRSVKPYRVDNVRVRVCSPEEIKTLLDGCSADLRLIARLTLESLPRLSEALNLRREDIGPTYATIVNSKSGHSRRVPLTPELRADLLARCHTSGYVFGQDKEGTPPKTAAISVSFSRLTRALGLHGISHHTLRHTGATVMVRNGVSLRAVQTIGGWTSLRMVERYAHVDDAELARAVRITHEHTEGAREGITNGITAEKTAEANQHGPSGRKS
jgi:integrase